MDTDLAYLEGLARESLSFPTQDGEPVVISYDTSSIASRFLDVEFVTVIYNSWTTGVKIIRKPYPSLLAIPL